MSGLGMGPGGWRYFRIRAVGLRSAAKMGKALAGFRLVEPRACRDRDQFVAGAAYCSAGFVVVLTAQRSMWETHREGMLRMAGSFRRKGSGERPVFDVAQLGRVRPDGSLISQNEGLFSFMRNCCLLSIPGVEAGRGAVVRRAWHRTVGLVLVGAVVGAFDGEPIFLCSPFPGCQAPRGGWSRLVGLVVREAWHRTVGLVGVESTDSITRSPLHYTLTTSRFGCFSTAWVAVRWWRRRGGVRGCRT